MSSINDQHIRMAYTRMRLSAYNFMVERGRWTKPKTEYAKRVCSNCKVIEDEYHCLVECGKFTQFQKKYLPMSLRRHPNFVKFISMFQEENPEKVRKYALLCCKVLDEYRKNVI